MSELTGGQVTVADLFRELVGMRTDITKVLTRMERIDERSSQSEETQRDHEGRLRAAETALGEVRPQVAQVVREHADAEARMRLLEKFRWQIAGALLAINGLAVLVEWYIWAHHG